MEFRQVGWNDVWARRLAFGFGRIGRAVARRAAGFRMRVILQRTTRAPTDVEREMNAEYLPRDPVLEQAEFNTFRPLRVLGGNARD